MAQGFGDAIAWRRKWMTGRIFNEIAASAGETGVVPGVEGFRVVGMDAGDCGGADLEASLGVVEEELDAGIGVNGGDFRGAKVGVEGKEAKAGVGAAEHDGADIRPAGSGGRDGGRVKRVAAVGDGLFEERPEVVWDLIQGHEFRVIK
jgi:hypothetical protein